jgi:type II secretory pathway pseudopilin PulG
MQILRRNRKQGFTYLSALILVVISGIALTGASRYWSTVVKREKEEELLFRGEQFRIAIESYYKSTPSGQRAYPRELEELVRDPRALTLRRHLRKMYPDPVTRDGVWGIERDQQGGIRGVFSRSQAQPLKTGDFPEAYKSFENAKAYSDWRFVYLPTPPPKPPPK